MATEGVTPRTYPVWFVSDGTEDNQSSSKVLAVTYESMYLSGFNARWVTPSECLEIRRKEVKMFVMDPFSGPVYEHLVSMNCRIMGPLCLYVCMRDSEVFPRRSYPVYSAAMKNMVVSCTKIGPSERAEIRRKVELMCGTYSEDLTRNVTHLVCGEVGSKKYHVAASFQLPIVQPEWVEEIWNSCQHKLLHGSSLPYKYFRCPIFKGLTITVSQLSSEERDYIKGIVEEEGGYYSSVLKMDKTTHLILLEPTGEKYKYAKEWQLFCVHEDWFYDSLEAGYCMDENLYPPKDGEFLRCYEPVGMDCSSSGLEESMQVEAAASATAPKSPFKRTIPSLDILDSLDLSSLPKCGDFLDGCKIFLSDFDDSNMKKLSKIINAGGGMRFNKYSDCISHVVCGKKNNKLIERIKASSARPHVVSFDWLIECCKEQSLVDEAPFSCMEKIPLTPDNEKMTPCKEENNVRRQLSRRTNAQKQPLLLDMEDIMEQYLPSS